PGLLVHLAPQVGRRLRHDYFERRPDDCLEDVAATGRAIRLADDGVGVDLRLALVDGDVPDEREDFDLLFDGNLSILLRFDVEEAKRRSAEGADRGEIAAVQAVLEGKALDPGHELLAGIENDNVGLESV